jgi:hypothetical protein
MVRSRGARELPSKSTSPPSQRKEGRRRRRGLTIEETGGVSRCHRHNHLHKKKKKEEGGDTIL